MIPPRAALPALAASCLLFAFLTACSPAAKPTAPPASSSPLLIATAPTARATGVLYDEDIWAQFSRPLDRTTVDSTTVFLKQDTRRLPITVTYEPYSHRILIQSRVTLELLKTYTVELAARIRSDAGGELGEQVFWQFTTGSLRRTQLDLPPRGSRESPFALLTWSGNGAISNTLLYELYAATDSLAVLNRLVPYLSRGTSPIWLPRAPWPSGQRTYWAITVVNTATGERLAGPMSSFDVIPADAAVDSLGMSPADYGGIQNGSRTQQCNQPSLPIGPAFNDAIRFPLAGGNPNIHVADAYVTMTLGQSMNPNTLRASLATGTWVACTMGYPGPPVADANGLLSTATTNGPANSVVFRGAALSAFVEAALRFGGWNGMVIGADQANSIAMNVAGQPSPQLHVIYYKAGAAPALRARR